MGFLAFCVAGVGFALIGAWNAFTLSYAPHPRKPNPPSTTITHLLPAIFSLIFILNASISAFRSSSDPLALPLQLQIIAVASLFLLHSTLSTLSSSSSPLLNLIALFAFSQELLLFYLQRKDPSGLENRYFDLLLVPISICVLSTLLSIKNHESLPPRFALSVGLILQGTWFLQMGFSFYTNLISHGCVMHEKSRGNYTVKCKTHMDDHRGRAIATLQFNCHLGFLVALLVAMYWTFAPKGGRVSADYVNYKPISEELRNLDNVGHFSLDSDEDEEIELEKNEMGEKVVIPVETTNGFATH